MYDEKAYEMLYEAIYEVEQNGKTNIKCPICNSELTIQTNGESAIAECKKCNIKATRRGL